ncbi:hypothetical protein TNCV_1369911 [Trichonephila clavipes]|nr:hypothetical protein TNCV_1369911 [Trichonephila clavipes]
MDLSLFTIATRVEHNVSIIERCVTRWIQEDLHARRRESGAHRCTSCSTDLQIHQLTIRNHFFTCDIEAGYPQEQVDMRPPKPYAADCMKCTYVHWNQQQEYR